MGRKPWALVFLACPGAGFGVDTDMSAAALSKKIAGELSTASRMVARELQGHPRELAIEERLLHEVGTGFGWARGGRMQVGAYFESIGCVCQCVQIARVCMHLV